MTTPNFYHLSLIEGERVQAKKRYFEFLRVPAMSAGVYVLPAEGTDPQSPHKEDEMYYVVRGKARMKVGAKDEEVSQGSVIFIAANEQHRFYDIREELVVLVFFAPAESS
jgi:mannose-6-phosphate isomerase-like protein (cupin superfamily)